MTESFFRRVRLVDLAEGPLSLHLVADAAVRRALADRFGLLALGRLDAEMTVSTAGAEIAVEGVLKAHVTQACVRSLEPVESDIEEPYRVRYVPQALLDVVEAEIDPEAAEDIEPLEPEGVDLGELVAQSLALALDPYPRRRGSGPAAAQLWNDVEAGEMERSNPFLVLKNLRNRS